MKKTITTLALLASSTSYALIGSGVGKPLVQKTYCLAVYENQDGSLNAGTCDQSEINRDTVAKLGKNGCAADQIALKTTDPEIKIKACPRFVQL